jgi:hypothetical protein
LQPTIFSPTHAYHCSQGTAICKVFNLAIGITGLSEKELHRLGGDMTKSTFTGQPCQLLSRRDAVEPQVAVRPPGRPRAGPQVVGAYGVDKRVDVLATAIRANLTVRDLCDLELSYAPPYGSAKDRSIMPVRPTNIMDGDVANCTSRNCGN